MSAPMRLGRRRLMVQLRPFVPIFVASAVLVSCASPSPTALASATPIPSASNTGSGWLSCAGDSFALAYPAGWFVHPADGALGVEECTLFAATEFEGEPESDWGWTGAQIVLDLESGCRGTFERVVTAQEVVIDGLPATRSELEAGEGPTAPEPFAYEYFINLTRGQPCEEGRWFYARTESDDPGDYDDNKRVLDEMLTSLRWAD